MTRLPPRCYTTESLKQFIDSQASIEYATNGFADFAEAQWGHCYDSCVLFFISCQGCRDHVKRSGMLSEYERRYYNELGMPRGHVPIDQRVA